VGRHRHLCAPLDGRRESSAESIEKREVRSVSQWVAAGVQCHRELQPDDGRDPCREINRQRTWISSFRPCKSVGADADAPRDLADAQPSGEPCVGQLFGNSKANEATSPGADCRDALSTGHGRSVSAGDHLSLTPM
jgi:hypothetical protein